MSGSTELMLLRLALIAVIFLFVAVVAVSLRSGLTSVPAGATRRAAPAGWRLVVVAPGESGLARGTAFTLAGSMLIGRDSRAGIMIPDASVSARHAMVDRDQRSWRVSDLGSTNGTFVEGNRVLGQKSLVLGRGDRLTLGNVVLQLESD